MKGNGRGRKENPLLRQILQDRLPKERFERVWRLLLELKKRVVSAGITFAVQNDSQQIIIAKNSNGQCTVYLSLDKFLTWEGCAQTSAAVYALTGHKNPWSHAAISMARLGITWQEAWRAEPIIDEYRVLEPVATQAVSI